MKTKLSFLLTIVFVYLLAFQCCSPVFSDLQNARTIGKNNFSASGFFSSYSNRIDYLDAEDVDGSAFSEVFDTRNLGLQGAYGFSDKFDISFRGEFAYLDDEGGYFIFGVNPKYSIIENKVALGLPLIYDFGINIQPTVYLSYPILDNKIDLNLSPKAIIPVYGGGISTLLGANMGFTASSDITKWYIQPEFGIVFHPGSDGAYKHFSIGANYIFQRN